MASKLASLKKGTRALRSEFKYPGKVSWYPGHMDKTMKQLKQSFLPHTNLILEIRDSRIPISSEHPHFNDLLRDQAKVVLFNKADLLNPKHRTRLKDWIDAQNKESSNQNQRFLMTADAHDYTKPLSAKHILSALHEMATDIKHQSPSGIPIHNISAQHNCSMIGVMGYPNTVNFLSNYEIGLLYHFELKTKGKSTVINLLRSFYHKRDSAAVGKLPGVTKHITYFRISSELYVLDTPGIFLPGDDGNTDMDKLMKLSICGMIADQIVGHYHVADYILYRLNLHKNYLYLKYCNKQIVNQPCDDIDKVLNAMSHHKHYCNPKKYLRSEFDPDRGKKVETYDEYLTALHLIDLYRNGKLDHCVLDPI